MHLTYNGVNELQGLCMYSAWVPRQGGPPRLIGIIRYHWELSGVLPGAIKIPEIGQSEDLIKYAY